MNEQPEGMQQRSGSGSPLGGFDLNYLLARVQQVILHPKQVWRDVKAERDSIHDIYNRYIIYLALIPAVCGLIGRSYSGVPVPFTNEVVTMSLGQSLWVGILGYATSLLLVYIGAVVAEFLAPKFGGAASRTDGFKLMAYSLTPSYLAGVGSLSMTLSILGLFGLYALYVFYQGIPSMTGVPAEKQLVFAIVFVISMIIVGIVVGLLLAIVGASGAMM